MSLMSRHLPFGARGRSHRSPRTDFLSGRLGVRSLAEDETEVVRRHVHRLDVIESGSPRRLADIFEIAHAPVRILRAERAIERLVARSSVPALLFVRAIQVNDTLVSEFIARPGE